MIITRRRPGPLLTEPTAALDPAITVPACLKTPDPRREKAVAKRAAAAGGLYHSQGAGHWGTSGRGPLTGRAVGGQWGHLLTIPGAGRHGRRKRPPGPSSLPRDGLERPSPCGPVEAARSAWTADRGRGPVSAVTQAGRNVRQTARTIWRTFARRL
jgi:hypothetical protein